MTDEAVAKTCAGEFINTDCYLASAIAEYLVTIHDDTITLTGLPSHPKIISRANNTAVTKHTVAKYGLRSDNGPQVRSTLSGISATAMQEFYCAGSLAPGNPPVLTGGIGTGKNLVSKSFALSQALADVAIHLCSGQWRPKDAWFGFQHITNYKAWDKCVLPWMQC